MALIEVFENEGSISQVKKDEIEKAISLIVVQIRYDDDELVSVLNYVSTTRLLEGFIEEEDYEVYLRDKNLFRLFSYTSLMIKLNVNNTVQKLKGDTVRKLLSYIRGNIDLFADCQEDFLKSIRFLSNLQKLSDDKQNFTTES